MGLTASARVAVDDVLTPLVADLRSALGDRLAALYLYGSVVSGGFDPAVSDIDLVAVVEARVEDLGLAALDAVHGRVTERNPRWLDRLEIVYVARASVAQPTRRDPVAVISPGEPFHLTGPSSDWLANWYLVRETGTALIGPPPAEVIAPIATEDFLGAVRRYLEYLRTVDSSGYAVLSACRAVRTLATGSPCSKQEGAAWLAERMPHWRWLIDAALQDRATRGASGFREQHGEAARQFVELLATEAFARR